MVLRYRRISVLSRPGNLPLVCSKGAAALSSGNRACSRKATQRKLQCTLDGYDGDTYVYDERRPEMPIEDGPLATDGWTLIDDSTTSFDL